MISKPVLYTAGAGIALVGSFFIFREWQKYQARKEWEELKKKAFRGEVEAEDFARLSTLLAPKASDKVFVLSNFRLPCSTVFPFTPEQIALIPGLAAAIAQRQADGDCLAPVGFGVDAMRSLFDQPKLPKCLPFEDETDGKCAV